MILCPTSLPAWNSFKCLKLGTLPKAQPPPRWLLIALQQEALWHLTTKPVSIPYNLCFLKEVLPHPAPLMPLLALG